MSTAQTTDAVFAWCLRSAERLERRGDAERAALWGYVAAGVATEFGHEYLCSQPLESMLLRLADRLPLPSTGGVAANGPRTRLLHVFSATAAIGGHTAIARRWIMRNPLGQVHNVVLTMQPASEVDPRLTEGVRRSGGEIASLADAGTLFKRANALRALAWEHADVVVLHTHMWDVVPTIAFAAPGGPAVLFINHADHAFWVGCSIADLVVDIRESGLGLSHSLRGVRASAVLPVPLEDPGPPLSRRTSLPARLAVDAGSPVLLTIGSTHKYRPALHLDFGATASRILDAVPASVLVAVGPRAEDPPWRALRDRHPDRVFAVGPDPDLAPWHAAADLYLESFPIGSYTALLEVALAARAFVRKPLLMPVSVLAIDRGALGPFEPPLDPGAYAHSAIALLADPAERQRRATEARASALARHCGAAWDAQLAAFWTVIPSRHEVGLGSEPKRIPRALAEYWSAVHSARGTETPLAYAQEMAHRQGLWPRHDAALVTDLGTGDRNSSPS